MLLLLRLNVRVKKALLCPWMTHWSSLSYWISDVNYTMKRWIYNLALMKTIGLSLTSIDIFFSVDMSGNIGSQFSCFNASLQCTERHFATLRHSVMSVVHEWNPPLGVLFPVHLGNHFEENNSRLDLLQEKSIW